MVELFAKFGPRLAGKNAAEPKELLNYYLKADDGRLVYCPDYFFGDLRTSSFTLSRGLIGTGELSEEDIKEEKEEFIRCLDEILHLVESGRAELEDYTYGIFNERALRKFRGIAEEMRTDDEAQARSRLNALDELYKSLYGVYKVLFILDKARDETRAGKLEEQLARK